MHAWLSFIPAPYELLFGSFVLALPCMSKILKFLFVLGRDSLCLQTHILVPSGVFAYRGVPSVTEDLACLKPSMFFSFFTYILLLYILFIVLLSQWLYHHPSHWEYIASFLPCHFPFLPFIMRRLLRFDYPLIERWYIGQFTFTIILRLYHNNDILSPI